MAPGRVTVAGPLVPPAARNQDGWKLFLFFIPGLSHLVLGLGDYPVVPANVAPGVGINASQPA